MSPLPRKLSAPAGTCAGAGSSACLWLLAASRRFTGQPAPKHAIVLPLPRAACRQGNVKLGPEFDGAVQLSCAGCRSKVKARIETGYGEWVERIPAWTKWATQEWNEIQFNGTYYAPPKACPWLACPRMWMPGRPGAAAGRVTRKLLAELSAESGQPTQLSPARAVTPPVRESAQESASLEAGKPGASVADQRPMHPPGPSLDCSWCRPSEGGQPRRWGSPGQRRTRTPPTPSPTSGRRGHVRCASTSATWACPPRRA